ncbi:juvenile hormone epoxide hydrolase-like [Aricia agestis]|uniref:juvenile hormone epoxide hydrolase-like n=1 Tax=Aricia agestis TaxID=91739 RepID=UPI001C2073BA|nr:juvenile hormone epoxide hydrolase-like [Aricia agestis]
MKNKQAKKGSENNEKDRKKSGSSSLLSFGKIFFLLNLGVGLLAVYIYKEYLSPPNVPDVDLNAYWGSYPMNPKPDKSIRKYEVEFSDVMANDLRERLLHRRPFPPPLEDAGFQYGFNSNFLSRVLDYWQNNYNFKEREQFFNRYDHFMTNIQGLDIHYIHVKPNVDAGVEVVPILLLHGWPGSIREFYEIIPKLISKRPSHNFVFEVIIPSLPGFGFSQAPSRPGLGPTEVAVILANLMKRIGIDKYYIQGGDAGHAIGSIMATLFQTEVLGFHTNMPVMFFGVLANLYTTLGSLWPSLIVEPELQSRLYPQHVHLMHQIEESGYFHIQATKPDTVGIGLTDSPAGLAAYILEKFSTWTNKDFRKASDGNLLSKFTLTHLIDNLMVYWSTNSITTSMRLYAETANKRFLSMRFDDIPTNVPTWGIKFKHELAFYPDCVLKLKYKNYLHSTVVEDGGHFAALEMPDVLADDIFEAVDTFQLFHSSGKKPQNIQQPDFETAKSIYDFTVRDMYGRDIKLDKYKGKVVLIVNVASQCGLTDRNYHQLNELYQKYAASHDLRILAFPCNQFNGQEPGSPKEILNFIKERGVKFDVFEKIEVNGENAHPLWKYLKRTKSGTFGDSIKWNFSKFIVDKNGVPVERFGPNEDPINLEPYLAKYW